MIYKDLQKSIVSVRKVGYGHWDIAIQYRGKVYHATTTNSMAVDRYQSDEDNDRARLCGYTAKQALQAMYNEVKIANNLGEYK